jgi:glycosyltransferase involved in cell wall biosynthesis
MKILLLSAYNTHSHNYWCNLLISGLPQFKWTLLTLPPRKFSWRIRGNALSWMAENNKVLLEDYDTVLATSMVDFSSIIGLYPHLGTANKVIYFHENQFEYPLSDNKGHSNVESMMVNLYGALAADKVIFNSRYNMESFFIGAKKLLKKINDHSPLSIVDTIEDKSSLLPVPICEKHIKVENKIKNSIIWNHRWEYDKNPEDFYKSLIILKDRGVDFSLIMMGIEFKNSPPAFNKIKSDFSSEILCWGHQTPEEYINWLKKGELIISTAIHEFQGLAVMEGVQYGAIPVVPNRLSYPEWFKDEYLYSNTPEDMATLMEKKFMTPGTSPNLNNLSWENLKYSYKKIITP